MKHKWIYEKWWEIRKKKQYKNKNVFDQKCTRDKDLNVPNQTTYL